MHVCMIDEKPHYPQQQPKPLREQLCFLLENVHPSKSFRPASFSRTRPQEPRRPRFSFFHLHNVKEPTYSPQRRNVVGATLRILSENRTSYPVARQKPCPVRKTSTVGANRLSVVNVAGCNDTRSRVSTPNFRFSFLTEIRNFQNSNKLRNFKSLLVSLGLAAPPSSAMGGL